MEFLLNQEGCFFGELYNELPIAKATISQYLKDAGLIQGEIEPPKVRYCINKENWKLAQKLFGDLLAHYHIMKKTCCELRGH